MTKVHTHPNSAFLLEVEQADRTNGNQLALLFMKAVDGKHAREALLRHFDVNKSEFHVDLRILPILWQWADKRIFLDTSRQPHPDTAIKADTASPQQDTQRSHSAAISNLSILGSEMAKHELNTHEEYSQLAAQYDYGLFFPGVEVAGSEWSTTFGHLDPCRTIAEYIGHLFSSNWPPAEHTEVVYLGSADATILKCLLRLWSKQLHSSIDPPSADYTFRYTHSLLKTSCNAWVWGGQISLMQLDLYRIPQNFPLELTKGLILHWSEIQHEADYNDQYLSSETFEAQAQYVSACVSGTLIASGVKENTVFPLSLIVTDDERCSIPTDLSLSVREIFFIKGALDNSVEQAWLTGSGISEVLSEAVYNARDPIFGGAFPFPIHDSLLHSAFWGIFDDPRFWLACMSNYGGIGYVPFWDPYSILPKEIASSAKHASNYTGNAQARDRFQACLEAYRNMRDSNLDELADAWWAYFIASQAHAFSHLGLSPNDIALVIDTAGECRASEMISASLKYALKAGSDDPETLGYRILQYKVQLLLKEHPGQHRSVVQLSQPTDATTFLIKTLGQDVWERLSDHSRLDLLQAEQLWGLSFRSAGDRTRDWGALILIYARVIEAEMRLHYSGLRERLAANGIPLSESTLGGIISQINRAYHAARKGEITTLSALDVETVKALHDLFTKTAPFMQDHRNRAAHGNRAEPLLIQELLRWQTALYSEGILRTVLNMK